MLALASCGSTSPGTTNTVVESPGTDTQTTAATQTTATTQTSTSAAVNSSIPTPGCRHVAPPASKADEQASKYTTLLDPALTYTVTLETNCGPIVIALAVAQAPKTTSSFAHLAKTGYYNGLTFHRVVPNFVIQGGDPKGNGTGGPSWKVVEPPPSNLQYTRGVVAMAKGPSEPSGASGSQFFIVTGANTNLPPDYALIGHVISGQSHAQAISHVPTEAAEEGGEASKPRVPIVIERAKLQIG